MLSFHVKFVQRDRWIHRQTDRWTTVKQYAPDLSIRGHKNLNPIELVIYQPKVQRDEQLNSRHTPKWISVLEPQNACPTQLPTFCHDLYPFPK